MKLNMLKYFDKLTDMVAALAFAELGELETAREMVAKYAPRGEHAGEWEKVQTAITFAESKEFDTAKDVLSEHKEYPTHRDDCQYGDNDLCYIQA
jgi:hypothetical protein